MEPSEHAVQKYRWGVAKFTWLSTERSWDEIYTYALDFDDDYCKVTGYYQVCADYTGAAYIVKRPAGHELGSLH